MSVIVDINIDKSQLRDQVAQRLLVAADEIFALFEQTFAQYQRKYQQVFYSKLLQDHQYHCLQEEPGERPPAADVQILTVPDVQPNLECVKDEEEEMPLDFKFRPLNLPPEENDNQAIFCEQRAAERQRAIVTKYKSLEPGEVEEFNSNSNSEEEEEEEESSTSDTDDSDSWEPYPKKITTSNIDNNGLVSKNLKNTEYVQNQPFAQKEKALSCPVCRKSFRENWYLKLHMRIHMGERPFRCEACRITFVCQQSLNEHQFMYHSSEMPYRCPVCHQCFADESEYDDHRENHRAKEPFSCLNCNKTYTIFRDLMAHKMSGVCFEEINHRLYNI